MSGFINNAKDFCTGFESVFPIGKITKFVAVKSFDFACNTVARNMCPPTPDFGGCSATVDRDAYNQVMNRQEYRCDC